MRQRKRITGRLRLGSEKTDGGAHPPTARRISFLIATGLACVALLAQASSAFAAPPANDDFANAQVDRKSNV